MKPIQAIALSLMMAMGFQASAETLNPFDLVIDGGFTLFDGVTETTQLFVDKSDDGTRLNFWVKVLVNPGIDNTGGTPVQQPVKAYVKYFPLSRYLEVDEQLASIGNFGVVNPYIDGAVICDLPNSTIRVGDKKVIMAYNCGSDDPDADTATFAAEELLKALRTETLQQPNLQGHALPPGC